MSANLSLSYDFTGLHQLKTQLINEANRLTREAVVAAGKVTVAKAKQGNFQDHTRQLRSTINVRNIGQRGDWYMVEVVAPMQYASFVEKGTATHEIWPKAAHGLNGPLRPNQSRRATGKGPHEHIVGRGLALRWASNGETFFARMVHHPGGRAIPFMEPAREYGQAYIETFINRGFAGIAARLESNG